jgi:hypothetical protein
MRPTYPLVLLAQPLMDLISEARLRAVSSLGESLFRYVAMR